MAPGSFRDQLTNPAPFPELLAHHWAGFRELSATEREYAPSGRPVLLSSLRILAWERFNRRKLLPWERRLIRKLDVAWVETVRKKTHGR